MLHPEEIIDLSEFLKRQGLHTTPYQVFAARRLLLSGPVLNGGTESLVRLSSLLRPIFCSSPEDQAKFDELYFEWLRQRSSRPPTVWITENPPPPPPPPPGIHWRMKVVGIALLILPILTVWFLWQDLRPRQGIGHVMTADTPISDATVRLGEHETTTDTGGRFSLPFTAKNMPSELTVDSKGFLSSRTTVGKEIKAKRNWLYLFPIDWKDSLDLGNIVLSKEEQAGPITKYPDSEQVPPPPAKLTLEKVLTLKQPDPSWWARLDYTTLGKVLAPVLLVLSWWLYRLTRRLGLKRQSGRIPTELKQVPIRAERIRQIIFPSLSLRHLTQRLRQPQFVESDELDVRRTIHLTMQRGGLFTPAYGTKREPGYLAFIDRSTMDDHQAHVAGQLVKDLALGSVLVRQYEFDEQPRMVRPVDPLRPAARQRAGGGSTAVATAIEVVPLETVQAKFPANRLLVFADPITCFDPLTGELRGWVNTLETWEERFLFTTSAPHQWGQAERILSRRGFQVVPLSLLGLRLFSTLLETGRYNGVDRPIRWAGMTGLQDRLPERWLERHPPSPEMIKRLLDDLERDFSQEHGGVNPERGKQGMLWLAACAAYPEIHWALTLEWGLRLFPQRQDAEVLLPKLTRLIWFRQAFMPDWFRQALYDRLTGSEADRLEEELSEILSAVNPEADEGLQLRIATQPGEPSESPEPVGRLRARFRRFQRKLKWQAVGQAAEPGNPMGDFVMLQYLSGKQGKALTPYAPKALRTLLFPKGKPWLGFRPAFLMVFAVVMSGGLWWWWDPIPVPVPSPIQEVGFLPNTNEVILKRDNGRVERWGREGQELVLRESGEEEAFQEQLSQVRMGQLAVPDPEGFFHLVYDKDGLLRLTVREDEKDEREVARESVPPSQIAGLHWPTANEAYLVIAPTETPNLLTITGLDGLRQQELARRDGEKAAAEAKTKAEEAAKLAKAKQQADLIAKKKAQQATKPVPEELKQTPQQDQEGRATPADEPAAGTRPAKITGKDGAPMVLVPAGEFTMGAPDNDKDGFPDERPAHPVYLDAFYIDQFEVTTARYATFFKETKRNPPQLWSEAVLKQHGNKPVVGVTWDDAQAYCQWAGKRLPTEAEWEKAARGTDQRWYPWGNDPPNKRLANFDNCCDFQDYAVLSDVGSFEGGQSPYGAYDMAGNVWEWMGDWYDRTLYPQRAKGKTPVRNPRGPEKGEIRVLRGGSWDYEAGSMRTSYRNGVNPTFRVNYIGFRCAQGAP